MNFMRKRNALTKKPQIQKMFNTFSSSNRFYYNFQIFLQSDFSLENSATFNTVLPWSQLWNHTCAEGPNQKNSVKLLQEKVNA